MRICILSDEDPKDFNPAPYMQGYDWEMVTMHHPVMDVIQPLVDRNEFDVYMNLCEGSETDEYLGLEVIRALEELNLPFTGCDSTFYDPTREEMQAVAEANGLGFARGFRVHNVEEADQLSIQLHYPLIVKHPQGFGSTGIIRESRVDTPGQLRVQVERVCSEFGAARMEEFIVGREYNVLVADNPDDMRAPLAYPPAELVFPPDEEFWHVDVKWNYEAVFDFKQVTEPELLRRLQDLARKMYLAMGGVGYGRCDIRMNEKGELFILEINPNGGIMFKPEEYGPADYMILYDPAGYRGFFDKMFRVAQLRRGMRSK